jgi:hypothetical protein
MFLDFKRSTELQNQLNTYNILACRPLLGNDRRTRNYTTAITK